MKYTLLFYFAFITNICQANMASPLRQGSINANAFTSKDISILQEHIDVRIFKGFKTAQFDIVYQIKNDVAGGQIPLLFLAKDYKGDFTVWVDGNLVSVKGIPNYIIKPKDSPFNNFNNLFNYSESGNEFIKIDWTENSHDLYKLDDLKYFETNLKKGIHEIRVSYTANVWVYNNEWIKEYSFRYSLAPATYWKSFGGLSVSIHNESGLDSVTTNLGIPLEDKFGDISNWKFNKLPVDVFEINYHPSIGKLASILIAIDPFKMMIIFGILVFSFHIWVSYWYRKRNLHKKISWVVFLGSILFPFLILCSYIATYLLIGNLLGEHASTRMGYYFLILAFYPVFAFIYLLVLWLIDLLEKRWFFKKL